MAWCTLSSSAYEKVTLLLSVSLTVVYTVAFTSPQWLVKDVPLISDIHAHVTIGLFKYCTEVSSSVPNDLWLSIFPSSCSSDGADDWQKIAAVLALSGLTSCVAMTVMSFVLVFVTKVKGNIKLQCGQAVNQFLTASTMTAVVILYTCNRRFLMPTKEKFTADLSWGYKLFLAAIVLCTFYMLCTICHIIMNFRPRSKRVVISLPHIIDKVEMTSKPTVGKREEMYMNKISISPVIGTKDTP